VGIAAAVGGAQFNGGPGGFDRPARRGAMAGRNYPDIAVFNKFFLCHRLALAVDRPAALTLKKAMLLCNCSAWLANSSEVEAISSDAELFC
jgi:hypothetical protein